MFPAHISISASSQWDRYNHTPCFEIKKGDGWRERVDVGEQSTGFTVK
jgi:hypothetical protein